ncbi:MAG: bifunctional riboflavin kinase/FAD synthetase [Bacteroidales bacterium]|jgi:riboflavin kinase/FMN adenylyltransferase|nr:bifunctional riboflavin kinase/FAD synthetase [Bacteroidales bacterium]MBP8677473.1 bifunctional riboflavin kinase/FAD synthetase [Bacteroidales bacterium]
MVVAATGFFDGVHRGHRAVLGKISALAKEQGDTSAVITLWPHPRTVLQQDAAKFRLLNSLEEKISLIKSFGIDEVFTLKFDKEFASQTTEEYFRDYLIRRLNVRTLVIGYDHRVGSDINQTQDEMMAIARNLGINPVRVDEYTENESGLVISSTKIREMLLAGDMGTANNLLGYRYGVEGVVVEGMKIGRGIGFPTANMRLYEPLKVLPSDGVYAVWVQTSGKTYRGITNIGIRPTVGINNERTIETHILDFDEDIYGLSIKLEFVAKMRDEVTFSSLEDLKTQLHKDRENSYLYLPENNITMR